MNLSYQLKRHIIRFLSDPSNWQDSGFDMDFYMDKSRRWRTKTVCHPEGFSEEQKRATALSIDIDDNGYTRGIRYIYGQSAQTTEADISRFFGLASEDRLSQRVHIEYVDNTVIIIDEAGRRVSFNKGDVDIDENAEGVRLSKTLLLRSDIDVTASTRTYEIPETGLTIFFDKNGKKFIECRHSNRVVEFDRAPRIEPDNLPNVHPYHVVSFYFDMFRNWGMTGLDGTEPAQRATKLIISRDFDVDPTLAAFNALDPKKAGAYINAMRFDYDVPEGVTRLPTAAKKEIHIDPTELAKETEIPWHDTTEFKGHQVDRPKRFRMQSTDNGFDVLGTLDHRDAILGQGQVFNQALRAKTPPSNIFGHKEHPSVFLQALSVGTEAEDHNGNLWRYAVLESDQANALAKSIRETMRDRFRLTPDCYISVNFKKGKCLIGMRDDLIKDMRRRYTATVAMLEHIQAGKSDKELMRDLVNEGADLVLIDPKAAQEAKTFIDVIEAIGTPEARKSYQEISGRRHTMAELLPR